MTPLHLAYFLIALGFLLLLAELVLPMSGLLLVLALAALVAGVWMTFVYGSDPSTGIMTLLAVGVALPLLGAWALYYWPRSRLGRRFFLAAQDEDATVARMPVHLELERLRGRYGRTVSALRPSGITQFDGRNVDTMSEGMLIEPGVWVRCIDVRQGKVLVRQAEAPPDLKDLENLDLG